MKPRTFFCLALAAVALLHPLLHQAASAGLFRGRRAVSTRSYAPRYVAPYVAHVDHVAVSTVVSTTTSNILSTHTPTATTITSTTVEPIVSRTIPAVATISEQKVLVPAIGYPYSFANNLGITAYNPYAPQYAGPGAAYQFAYQQPQAAQVVAQPQPQAQAMPPAQTAPPADTRASADGKKQYDQLVNDVTNKLVSDPRLYEGIAKAIRANDSGDPPAEPEAPAEPPKSDSVGLDLLKQNCAACHTEGSPKLKGKMPVLFGKDGSANKEVLAKKATAIVDAIRDGRMPPKGIDPATGKQREPVGQDEYWAIKTWLEKEYPAEHASAGVMAITR